MQSILQYRRLRSRLQLEYRQNQEKVDALSSSTQDSGLSSLVDIYQTASNDTETASTALKEVPSAKIAEGVQPDFSSAPDLCPNLEGSALSKSGLSRRDLILACGVGGVTVRDCSIAATDAEKVFVVGAGSDDEGFNPWNWTRSYRIWATCVLPT